MDDVEHWSPACVQKHISSCVIHTRNWHALNVWLWPIGFHRDKRILCVQIESLWVEQVAGRLAAWWHSQSLLIKSGSAVSVVGELPTVTPRTTGTVKLHTGHAQLTAHNGNQVKHQWALVDFLPAKTWSIKGNICWFSLLYVKISCLSLWYKNVFL